MTGAVGTRDVVLTPSVRRPADFIEFPREEIESSISARFQRVLERYPKRVAVKVGDCRHSYRALKQAETEEAMLLRKLEDLSDEVAQRLLLGGPREVAG